MSEVSLPGFELVPPEEYGHHLWAAPGCLRKLEDGVWVAAHDCLDATAAYARLPSTPRVIRTPDQQLASCGVIPTGYQPVDGPEVHVVPSQLFWRDGAWHDVHFGSRAELESSPRVEWVGRGFVPIRYVRPSASEIIGADWQFLRLSPSNTSGRQYGAGVDARGAAGVWRSPTAAEVGTSQSPTEAANGWWRKPTSYLFRASESQAIQCVTPPPEGYQFATSAFLKRCPGAVAGGILRWDPENGWVRPSFVLDDDHAPYVCAPDHVRLLTAGFKHRPLPPGHELTADRATASHALVNGRWQPIHLAAEEDETLFVRPELCRVKNNTMPNHPNLIGQERPAGKIPSGYHLLTQPDQYVEGDRFWSVAQNAWVNPNYVEGRSLERADVWIRQNVMSKQAPKEGLNKALEKEVVMNDEPKTTLSVVKSAMKDAAQRNAVRRGLDVLENLAQRKFGEKYPELLQTELGRTLLRVGLPTLIMAIDDATDKVPASVRNISEIATQTGLDDGMNALTESLIPLIFDLIQEAQSDPAIEALMKVSEDHHEKTEKEASVLESVLQMQPV